MRASDATNALRIDQARRWHEHLKILVETRAGLTTLLEEINAARYSLPKERQKSFRQAERWALEERIYIIKLEAIAINRLLHNSVCDLERRLCESNAEVWKIIKGE